MERQLLNTTVIGLCAGFAALIAAPLGASAQDAIAAPAQKTIGQSGKNAMIPSLAVINSRGASLQGDTLTMTDVSSNSIIFADRPFRAAGHVLTRDFLKEWDQGSDSFAKDPPNATISVLSAEGDSVEDAVVVLKSPKLEGDKLTFEVSVLEGGLSKATGPVALHRLVRSARLWRSRIRRRRLPWRRMAWRRMAWRVVRSPCRVCRGSGRRWPRRRGGRCGGRGRLLPPLRLSLRAAALRVLSLSAVLLRRRGMLAGRSPSRARSCLFMEGAL
jgi:hypothetical protein